MSKALVAGDVPFDAEMIAASIRGKEFASVVVCDLCDVVAVAKIEQPDLIILDGMTYADAARSEIDLAFDPETREIPVVRITVKSWDGLAEQEDRDPVSRMFAAASTLQLLAAIAGWIAVHWVRW